MTYTHRNIHTGRLCYIAEERNIDGHTVYFVHVQFDSVLHMWPVEVFRAHHEEVVDI